MVKEKKKKSKQETGFLLRAVFVLVYFRTGVLDRLFLKKILVPSQPLSQTPVVLARFEAVG